MALNRVFSIGIVGVFLTLLLVSLNPDISFADPSVWTDKRDYPPGDTVVISGSGFPPNIPLAIQVLRPRGMDMLPVEADAEGSFTLNYELTPKRAMEGAYTILVFNPTNRQVLATTEFTDSSTLSLSPTSIGNFDGWAANTGAKVDAVAAHDGDASYIFSSSDILPGARQTFGFPGAGLPTDATINSVTLTVVGKKGSGRVPDVKLTVENTGHVYDSPTSYLLTGFYQAQSWTLATNPDTGSAWTVSEVNSWPVNFGVLYFSGSTEAQVTQIYVDVEYTTSSFTAAISPLASTGCVEQTYTVTITNDASSTEELGSATIQVPSGFTDLAFPVGTNPVAPIGKIWNESFVSGVIQLKALNDPAKLSPGESVSINFSASNPEANTYTWTTDAWANRDLTGNSFALNGSQPQVTISTPPSYSVTFDATTGLGLPSDVNNATDALQVRIGGGSWQNISKSEVPKAFAGLTSCVTVDYEFYTPLASTDAGKQYRWNSTSSTGIAPSQTSRKDSFTLSDNSTLTATYWTQYSLDISTNFGSTAPAAGSYMIDAGEVVSIFAMSPSAAAGEWYVFDGWSGSGSGSYSGLGNASVTMNGPINETSSWTHQWIQTDNDDEEPELGIPVSVIIKSNVSSATVGGIVGISGNVTWQGIPVSCEVVILETSYSETQYVEMGRTWSNDNGTYEYTWMPTETGNIKIMAVAMPLEYASNSNWMNIEISSPSLPPLPSPTSPSPPTSTTLSPPPVPLNGTDTLVLGISHSQNHIYDVKVANQDKNYDHDFTLLIQVKNAEGVIVYLGRINMALDANGSIAESIEVSPSNFTIEVFAWRGDIPLAEKASLTTGDAAQ